MGRIRNSVTAGLVAVVAATAFGAQASAKDWASSFPSGADVMPALGKYDAAPGIDAGPAPKGGWFPCAAFTAPSAKTVVIASYAPTSKTEKTLEVRSYVYASNAKAKQAFTVIQKKLSTCDGREDLTFSDSGPNTMRKTTTTGTVPEIEITGVTSLYIYGRTVPIPGVGKPSRDSAGSYSVIVLVNDTIMMTNAAQVGKAGYTADQRAAVMEFASAAETTWVNAGN
jgi:hypothetical protein